MSRRSRFDSLEIVRHKISMAQKIAQKDKDYGLYAGASGELADIMTLIDWGLEKKFFHDEQFIRDYRDFLDKQRKAHLAVFSTEITRLGFIIGSPYVSKSAIKR